ncbi:Pr6Pr family membrane protein [Leucobacter chinensis]|uniref:Pr6Pr family membrane protein n=1 Tax=Leucobacter chinensis TaxID=2851010 RepID=UPI001C2150C1|nr:Pr6Pr family membrane protein [Leucobacter chinensis]
MHVTQRNETQATAHRLPSPAPDASGRFIERGAIANRWIALAYRAGAIIAIAMGIARITGLLSGSPSWDSLLFFTVQSNILCLLWVAALIVVTLSDLAASGAHGTSTPSARLSGAVMMAITVTMLIYLVVLVPTTFEQAGDYEVFSLTDNLVHIITPCLVIVDWLLFVPKGSFRWIEPPLWALIPYAYLVFAFTAGAAGVEFNPGQTYPYPFMNVAELGVGGVALWIIALSVALIGFGYVYVVVDRLLSWVGKPVT